MNKIKLSGTIIGEPTYSHKARREKMYEVYVGVKRKTDTVDILFCIVPEVLLNGINDGDKVSFIGEIRTRNVTDGNKKRLQVYVFVKETDEYIGHDDQTVEIEGYICKEPLYRETPLGREITDVLIASNREHNFQSDYIPCIAWGRNARRASCMNVSCAISATGRLQSRQYVKRLEDGTEEIRTAYELSLNTMEVADESNN